MKHILFYLWSERGLLLPPATSPYAKCLLAVASYLTDKHKRGINLLIEKKRISTFPQNVQLVLSFEKTRISHPPSSTVEVTVCL